jgi:hypothetical protein
MKKTIEEIKKVMAKECANKIAVMEQNLKFAKKLEEKEFWKEQIEEQKIRLVIISGHS